MPTSKDVLALRWANKTEEEKKLVRKKNAERIRKMRAKNGRKKRSDLDTDELLRQRVMDRNNKRQQRKNLTEEKRLEARTKDRKQKAKKNSESKEPRKEQRKEKKKLEFDLDEFEKKKTKQLSNNCKTQQKILANRTEEEEEEVQIGQVKKMRKKRSMLKVEGKMLARLHAKEGMREHRKFGYIREYKQRKRRESFDPESWEKDPHAISEYFEKVKQQETEKERKEEKKRQNRIRVEKHRMKIKKMLQDPVQIENYGEKSEYELFREKNILERERLMKESGLFD